MSGRYIAVEFLELDHRPLGVDGTFLHGSFGESEVATFATEQSANEAVAKATNRRPGSTVSLIGTARRAA